MRNGLCRVTLAVAILSISLRAQTTNGLITGAVADSTV